MRELVSELGERSRRAVAHLLPGPVTLVIANPGRRYPLASRDDPERLGVRLIEGPLAGTVTPIFQTSANRSGERAPRGFDEIDQDVLSAAEVAIDGGELIGAPSTVVEMSELDSAGRWDVLREGALPSGVIDEVLEETAPG
jgi:L-threonylcarbamoyladenylate synthase